MEIYSQEDLVEYRDLMIEATATLLWLVADLNDFLADVRRLEFEKRDVDIQFLTDEIIIEKLSPIFKINCLLPDAVLTNLERAKCSQKTLPLCINPSEPDLFNYEVAAFILKEIKVIEGINFDTVSDEEKPAYRLAGCILSTGIFLNESISLGSAKPISTDAYYDLDFRRISNRLIKNIREETASIIDYFPLETWSIPLTKSEVCSLTGIKERSYPNRVRSREIIEHPSSKHHNVRVALRCLPADYEKKIKISRG